TNMNSRTATTAAVGGFNAILDQGTEFEGKLTFQGTVRIDGTFKGEVFFFFFMVIGPSGRVEGDAEVGSIAINGQFYGNINAKEKVELSSSAIVEGDITTPSLVIEDGVKLNGKVNMNPDAKMNRSSIDDKPLAGKTSTKPTNGVGTTPAQAG
ncbi:MAG: polymer-forming cytoskeletal protein, partial [Deltaproteobacteria bacterium]|nr:polymer-forming cytoskeletal protein [Deltaproteobacteria bacterium]